MVRGIKNTPLIRSFAPESTYKDSVNFDSIEFNRRNWKGPKEILVIHLDQDLERIADQFCRGNGFSTDVFADLYVIGTLAYAANERGKNTIKTEGLRLKAPNLYTVEVLEKDTRLGELDEYLIEHYILAKCKDDAEEAAMQNITFSAELKKSKKVKAPVIIYPEAAKRIQDFIDWDGWPMDPKKVEENRRRNRGCGVLL